MRHPLILTLLWLLTCVPILSGVYKLQVICIDLVLGPGPVNGIMPTMICWFLFMVVIASIWREKL